jgi:hypothetical protein
MDATSNVVKRNVLAEHLKEVIDVLEKKVGKFCFMPDIANPSKQGDQIATLYHTVQYKDKMTCPTHTQ